MIEAFEIGVGLSLSTDVAQTALAGLSAQLNGFDRAIGQTETRISALQASVSGFAMPAFNTQLSADVSGMLGGRRGSEFLSPGGPMDISGLMQSLLASSWVDPGGARRASSDVIESAPGATAALADTGHEFRTVTEGALNSMGLPQSPRIGRVDPAFDPLGLYGRNTGFESLTSGAPFSGVGSGGHFVTALGGAYPNDGRSFGPAWGGDTLGRPGDSVGFSEQGPNAIPGGGATEMSSRDNVRPGADLRGESSMNARVPEFDGGSFASLAGVQFDGGLSMSGVIDDRNESMSAGATTVPRLLTAMTLDDRTSLEAALSDLARGSWGVSPVASGQDQVGAAIPPAFHQSGTNAIAAADEDGRSRSSGETADEGGYQRERPLVVHTSVQIDGDVVARAVGERMVDWMNGPLAGTGGFDPRRSYTPVES